GRWPPLPAGMPTPSLGSSRKRPRQDDPQSRSVIGSAADGRFRRRFPMLNPSRLALIAGTFLASVVPLTAAQQPQPPTAPAPAAQTPPANVPFVPASTPEQEQLRFVPAKRYGGQVHLLPATLETTQWGWFNNAQPPARHVNS